MTKTRLCCAYICARTIFSTRATSPRVEKGLASPLLTSVPVRACIVRSFMKGNKMFPQCGFSNTAVMILKSIPACGEDGFETFDVLADQEIREGIKAYSSWPTIPQVRDSASHMAANARSPARAHNAAPRSCRPRAQCYIDGEFIGGCDILIEMYQAGELQELVEKAKAS